jgi:hypothetical protein
VRERAVVLAVLVLAFLAGVAGAARADDGSAEQQLADRYAPVVALKEQPKSCNADGEPYRPVPADVVLGRSDVKLVDSTGRLLVAAPTVADLYGRGEDTYLDLPGSPLSPGCSYEQWAREISAGKETTAYAHVVTEAGKPGKLALQYWLYYPFNDWNNKHESDWEMIQLLFDAPTASAALSKAPVEIGYSQHSGAERAFWDDAKLQKQGTHPVVFPGRGSHANYFRQTVWLGASAQEGFGCDNTSAPSRRVQTHAVLLPDQPPASASAPFAWLAFQGHWGQKEHGPNTGPTGPNAKGQWTEPVSWSEDEWRSSSTEIPFHHTLGPSATSFFCGAVAAGSHVYLQFLRTPWFVLGVLAALVLFGIWLSRRTRWRPVEPFPVDDVRSGGQIYRAGFRLYRRYRWLFLGLGVIFVPLAALASLAQAIVTRTTGFGAFLDGVKSDAVVSGVTALLFGELSTIIASILVTAAVAHALSLIEQGDRPDALDVFKGVWPRIGSLGWAWFRIILTAGLLALTIVGIPLAVVYLVRKAVTTQACVLEDLHASPALGRSSELVRRHGPRVFAISALVNVTAFLLGPIVGVAALFVTPAPPLGFVNLISSAVYAVVVPYAAIALTLLFFDLRRRLAGEEPSTAPTVVAVAAAADSP